MQTLTPAMRRSALITILRDKTMWPKKFRWDFMGCHSCARGLAHLLLGLSDVHDNGQLRDMFGLTEDEAMSVFAYSYWRGPSDAAYSYEGKEWGDSVTPKMVADKLETLHNKLVAEGR